MHAVIQVYGDLIIDFLLKIFLLLRVNWKLAKKKRCQNITAQYQLLVHKKIILELQQVSCRPLPLSGFLQLSGPPCLTTPCMEFPARYKLSPPHFSTGEDHLPVAR